MKNYQEQILISHIASMMDENHVLVEDGNKAHGTKNKDMKQKKQELGINWVENWPPSSPDLNIIENIWRLLKSRLKTRPAILDIEALKAALQEEWDKLTQEEIRQYIVSMPERVMEACEKKGLATQF